MPVVFISGDQNACADARSFLPWVEAVEVKQAVGRYAAASLSPRNAQAAIKAGLRKALEGFKDRAKPYRFSPPLELEMVFASTAKADVAELLPGSVRSEARTLRFTGDDFLTVFKAFRAMLALGGSIS